MILSTTILFTLLLKTSLTLSPTINPQIARIIEANPAMKPHTQRPLNLNLYTKYFTRTAGVDFTTRKWFFPTIKPTIKYTPPSMEDELIVTPPYYVDHEINHLKMLKKIRSKSHARPDRDTGRRLIEWHNNPSSKGNPEELSLVYFEGDILLPATIVTRSGLTDEGYRWPKGIIPYKITGNFSSADLKMIQSAIDEFHINTCIRFVRYTGYESDYIIIENAETGCWSSVGRIGGQQTVNLQSPGCLRTVGTVLHELMHVLGFFHEQSRMDRDTFVNIEWTNIIPGQERNFDTYDSTAFGLNYDYGSVMHYSAFVFSKNTLPTITTKTSGVTIGQRKCFSKNDIEEIKSMYQCQGPISLLPL